MGVTRISTEYPLERFQHDRPEAVIVATLDDKARLKLAPDLEKLTSADGMRILHFSPPLTADPDRQGAPKGHNPALTLGHGVINRPQDKG